MIELTWASICGCLDNTKGWIYKMVLSLRIIGLTKDVPFFRSKLNAQVLQSKYPNEFAAVEAEGLSEMQWTMFMKSTVQNQKGDMWSYRENVIVFVDDKVLGSCEDFLKWAKETFDFSDMRPLPFYYSIAKDSYNEFIMDSKVRDCVYFDISTEGEPLGRIVFELHKTLCPKACENFKALCTGEKGITEGGVALTYKHSLIHRIVPNGWIQGGDVCGGSGAGGVSIFGDNFADECFTADHSSRGVLGMVNKGPNTNASQFYITLMPSNWMDKQYQAFGRVLEGSKVLEKLERLETFNERPIKQTIISDCGVLQPLEVLSME